MLSHDSHLEGVVGAVHHGRGGNGHFYGEKQGKNGHEKGPQAEARKEGQARRHKGCRAHDKIGGHGAFLSASSLPRAPFRGSPRREPVSPVNSPSFSKTARNTSSPFDVA